MVERASETAGGEVGIDRLARSVTLRPAVTLPSDHRCSTGTHSRLDDGRRLCWTPLEAGACRAAVDAERLDRPPPRALAARVGHVTDERFWWLWTRAEARAKVRDIPILDWLRRVDWTQDGDLDPGTHAGADAGAVHVLSVAVEDLMISYAFGAPDAAVP